MSAPSSCPGWSTAAGRLDRCAHRLAATVLGALELRRRRTTLVPFVAALAVVLVTTTLFYGLTRFHITYDVASCLLCGVLAAGVAERIRARRTA